MRFLRKTSSASVSDNWLANAAARNGCLAQRCVWLDLATGKTLLNKGSLSV